MAEEPKKPSYQTNEKGQFIATKFVLTVDGGPTLMSETWKGADDIVAFWGSYGKPFRFSFIVFFSNGTIFDTIIVADPSRQIGAISGLLRQILENDRRNPVDARDILTHLEIPE